MAPILSSGIDGNLNLQEVISKGLSGFDEWTLLISEVEKLYPADVDKICLVYNNFLSKFPLCHGYWRKYAAHMTCISTTDKVVEVFEKAVLAATYSVGVWFDYCSFGMSAFEDPSDIRSFKKLLTILEEGIANHELQSETCFDCEIPMVTCYKDGEIYHIINDMMDSSVGLTSSVALKRYRAIGEMLYHNACELYSKISPFEASIRRHYFHVQPLDANQLQNWHNYLDFIELQGDFDWAVKLYERCLIVCANYPEYWMRCVDFMEAKGGREIANYSLDRATEIYLTRVPSIHLFNARFKEQIGDVFAARAAYVQSCEERDSDFVDNVISKANMEKRLGNTESAFSIYNEALKRAATEEKLHALPILYIHFSRLKYISTNSVDAARDVLIDGIRTLPHNKLLLQELIKFSMMHGGTKHMAVIDSIIADTISPRSDGSQGLSAEDAEDISNLYLEFVDYIGTIHDVRKAWNRHIKLFPDSARKDLHEQSARHRKLLNLMDKREDISIVTPNQASRDSISDLQEHLHKKDEKTALLKCCENQYDATNGGSLLGKNKSTRSNDTDAYKLQSMELNDKIEENRREFPLPVSEEPKENDPENNVPSSHLVEVKEESTRVVKNLKNSSESDVSSEEFLRQTGRGNQSSHAFQTPSNKNTYFSKGKREVESEELKAHSLTSMSSKSRESTCPDSGPMVSQECVAIPESHKENTRAIIGGHTINQENSASTQDSGYNQVYIETKSPYSARYRDQRSRKPFLPPRSSGNSGGNWHRRRNAGQFKGPKFGYRGNTDRKQHLRQQLSPQQIHPPEGGAQMAGAPDYSSQPVLQVQQCNPGKNQFQSTATTTGLVAAHCWPMQNMQMQNTSSQSQTPGNATSLVLQHPMQGNDQYGYMQNAQEYSQLCQYYYYQQQQQLQHYIQLQQQPFQKEQSLQLQHSPLEPLQPQQLQHSPLEPLQPQQLQQQQLQHSLLEPLQPQQLQQQVLQQQQYYQQQQPSTQLQSSSHPVENQGQVILSSQSNGAIVSQQSDRLGSISSPVLDHSQEKSTQE
ncbi:pre-mRNA-processing factor 39-2 isoform X3 [Vigna angularis]|uniref:pre-mRNA-processing factor 39-2 isoform X3 n=1 Tax=Phaseolus angularis TaxID=3914 RepID=UPI00080A3EBD|nr:pre-mRNA-processing factor 39-2 isoform X3 [Vigna angularis]